MSETISVLDIGAGEHPHPDADVTMDARSDLADIDYPDIDIGIDEWPLEDHSVEHIVCSHVIEHIPPNRIGHVLAEMDRVLVSGGSAEIRLPHAGTWGARTDPTHFGTGGTTADVDRYFTSVKGSTAYWPSLDWAVSSTANVEWPVFLPKRLRVAFTVTSGHLSHELVKLPFVTAEVVIDVRKR